MERGRGGGRGRGASRGGRGGRTDNKHETRDTTSNINEIVPENAKAGVGFVDTHCHVEYIMQKLKYGTFKQLVDRQSIPANFDACISIFCDPAALSPSFGLWRDLVEQNSNVYAAFGIHPHNAKYYNDSVEQRILECMTHEKAVAWGECGLDYAKNNSEPEIQRQCFRRQLGCAIQLNKPIVIHSRDAADDTFDILKDLVPENHPIHLHCFTDGPEEAKRFCNAFSNLYVGFTGLLTYPSAENVVAAAKVVPLERILLETDGPYMPPEPIPRGKASHPGHIPIIAQKLAQIKGVDYSEVLKAIRENTKLIYGI